MTAYRKKGLRALINEFCGEGKWPEYVRWPWKITNKFCFKIHDHKLPSLQPVSDGIRKGVKELSLSNSQNTAKQRNSTVSIVRERGLQCAIFASKILFCLGLGLQGVCSWTDGRRWLHALFSLGSWSVGKQDPIILYRTDISSFQSFNWEPLFAAAARITWTFSPSEIVLVATTRRSLEDTVERRFQDPWCLKYVFHDSKSKDRERKLKNEIESANGKKETCQHFAQHEWKKTMNCLLFHRRMSADSKRSFAQTTKNLRRDFGFFTNLSKRNQKPTVSWPIYRILHRTWRNLRNIFCCTDVLLAECFAKSTKISGGKIQSPNYPLKYLINQTCEWHIHARSPQSRILLQFPTFAMEGSRDGGE